MPHANAQLLEKMYLNFSRGDHVALLADCAENITFQIAGKSPLAGKYTKENFGTGLMLKLQALSNKSFKLEVHDIMASDRHGVVLASEFLTRNGEQIQIRTVHIWRFENGKPVAWYAYPRDLYQFDSAWA